MRHSDAALPVKMSVPNSGFLYEMIKDGRWIKVCRSCPSVFVVYHLADLYSGQSEVRTDGCLCWFQTNRDVCVCVRERVIIY